MMRWTKGAKLVVLILLSVCFLSVWKSMMVQPQTNPVPIETYNINRKSLAYQGGNLKPHRILPNNVVAVGNANNNSSSSRNESSQRNQHNKNDENAPQSSRHQTRTILMSYMRSGSTFTGALFQSSSDVMYLYEPLLYTNDVDDLPKDMPIKSRVISKFFNHPNLPDTLNYTLSTLKCDLSISNMKLLIGHVLSRSFDDYAKCSGKGVKNPNHTLCCQAVKKRCQGSRNVISKILRLKMWEVDQLLTSDPELKVIHLVRDPRGITMSRRVAGYYLSVPTLCERMRKDAVLSIDLQKKYPGRLVTVRYEDIAKQPIKMAKQLFQFAGVNWTQQVAGRIEEMTSPKNKSFKEKIFDTKRKNSSATAFNWRTQLQFSVATNVQKFCKDMMKLYGYVDFKSAQDMTNLNSLSLKDDYSHKFYKVQNFSTIAS